MKPIIDTAASFIWIHSKWLPDNGKLFSPSEGEARAADSSGVKLTEEVSIKFQMFGQSIHEHEFPRDDHSSG